MNARIFKLGMPVSSWFSLTRNQDSHRNVPRSPTGLTHQGRKHLSRCRREISLPQNKTTVPADIRETVRSKRKEIRMKWCEFSNVSLTEKISNIMSISSNLLNSPAV